MVYSSHCCELMAFVGWRRSHVVCSRNGTAAGVSEHNKPPVVDALKNLRLCYKKMRRQDEDRNLLLQMIDYISNDEISRPEPT
jgi:hypothetical protein